MKIIAFLSTTIFIVLTINLFYGFALNHQSEIEEIITIEAPTAVVWNSLVNFKEHPKWLKSIKALYNYKNSARQVHYNFGKKTILVNQQVRVRESAKAIDFFQIGKEKFSGLQGISGQMSLLTLPDGNTEVHWKIMYSLSNISQKIIARYTTDGQFKNLLHENLIRFKKHIEE